MFSSDVYAKQSGGENGVHLTFMVSVWVSSEYVCVLPSVGELLNQQRIILMKKSVYMCD